MSQTSVCESASAAWDAAAAVHVVAAAAAAAAARNTILRCQECTDALSTHLPFHV